MDAGAMGTRGRRGLLGALIFTVLSVVSLSAQQVSSGGVAVTGVVGGWTTRIPLPDADVLLVGADRRTTADAEGRFVLEGIPRGTHLLRISRRGFVTQDVEVTATNATAPLDIRLFPSPLPSLNGTAGITYGESRFKSSPARDLCELKREMRISGLPSQTDDASGILAYRPCHEYAVAEIHQIDVYQCGFEMTGLAMQGGVPRRPGPVVRVYTKAYAEYQAVHPQPRARVIC
jgi:hypothetical protein